MDENNEYETLFIDEEYEPVLTEDEARHVYHQAGKQCF